MSVLKTMIVIAALSLALPGAAWAQTPPAGQKPAPTAPAGEQKPTPAPTGDQKPTPPAQAPAAAPKPFPEGAKIGFVRLQYIASNSVEGKAATAKIQEFTKKKQAELAEKNKELEALRNKLLQGAGVLSEQARNQMEKDIDRMARELQFEQQNAQAETTQLTQDLQNEFQQRLNPILDQVANEKGLHIMFSIDDAGAVWVNTGLDLSAEVLKRLDASSKASTK